MPRPKKGPRLGGSAQHERHMLANLATQLIVHESITTTEARARRLRPYVEKLITKGKRGDLHARRTVMKKVANKFAVYRLFDVLAPQFEGRDGGYTRIVKTAPRKGDNAPMAVISLVLEPVARKEVVADAVRTARRAAEADSAVGAVGGEAGNVTVEAAGAEEDEGESTPVVNEDAATDAEDDGAEPESAAATKAAKDAEAGSAGPQEADT